jgi:hypothetical protein
MFTIMLLRRRAPIAAGHRPRPTSGTRQGPGGDEATGANIVKVALEAPPKQIAVIAGLERGVVAEKVRGLTAGEGLDAATGPLYSRTRQSTRAGRPPACHLAGSGCDHERCKGQLTCLGS